MKRSRRCEAAAAEGEAATRSVVSAFYNIQTVAKGRGDLSNPKVSKSRQASRIQKDGVRPFTTQKNQYRLEILFQGCLVPIVVF